MTKRKTPALPIPVGRGQGAGSGSPSMTGPVLLKGPLAPRKPMARATRLTLFEREVHERLSRAALDIVFSRAALLSEGQRTVRGGKHGYVGSTMLTIDLAALADVLRDPCDAGTAHRLAELMGADATLPRRIQDLAASEAARVAGAPLTEVRTHVTVRAQGARVFIDVDVEAGL